MRVEVQPGVRLFVDIEGPAFVPDGPVLREKPTLMLLHGGPGRAGGGEELGGTRGMDLYTQRVAIQGDTGLLKRLLGKA